MGSSVRLKGSVLERCLQTGQPWLQLWFIVLRRLVSVGREEIAFEVKSDPAQL